MGRLTQPQEKARIEALNDARVQRGAWLRDAYTGAVWVVDHLEQMPDTVRVWLESATRYQEGTKLANSIYHSEAVDIVAIVKPSSAYRLVRRA